MVTLIRTKVVIDFKKVENFKLSIEDYGESIRVICHLSKGLVSVKLPLSEKERGEILGGRSLLVLAKVDYDVKNRCN